MSNESLSRRLMISVVTILAAAVGAAVASLLTSSFDWEFAVILVGALAVVRIVSDLVGWQRARR